MRTLYFLISVVCLDYFITGAVVVPRDPLVEEYAALGVSAGLSTFRRATPNSPTGGYTPGQVDCPSNRPTIRSASTLSANEISWLLVRRNKTVLPMISLLTRANIPGFDASSYISGIANNASTLPNIGIAISGGGYRALMNGAGFIAAADNRTTNSTGSGQIGGLLQATTYLAGLSGGSWLVGSIYINNFSSVVQLRDGSSGSSVWQFGNSIFQGPASSGLSILNTTDYYSNILSEVSAKANAGFDTSITDYWGRALSYQLINATDGGPAYTWSSIALDESFVNGDTPFPVLVADSRIPGTTLVSLNSTVYEVNPFELGSWDPTMYAFAPLEYLGSNFSAGTVPAGQYCIRGFDNAGYIMGTSSSLFNQFLLYYNTSSLPLFFSTVLTDIAQTLGSGNDDTAQYGPNPFYYYNNATNQQAKSTFLTLVDGGEDLQNLPLYPLIQSNRYVDVIFAVDSSADTTTGWPNGTSLVATYERSLNTSIENSTAFPSIPDQNTFVNLGLNSHPTFFGCNASNTMSLAPLIVYMPNGPYITQSNVSTFDDAYNNTQRNLIIENGYDAATLGNGTLDSQWSICVACAVLSRSFYKTGTSVPSSCTTCFSRYCWNGTTNSTMPSGNYTPEYIIGEVAMASSSSAAIARVGSMCLFPAVVVCIFFFI